MEKRAAYQILLIGVILVCMQAGSATQAAAKRRGTATKARPATRVDAAKKLTLDLVFTGPFAFRQQADGILVLLPDIEDHNPPTAITSGDLAHVKTLQRGNYDFTKGVQPTAGNPKPVIPVQTTAVFSVSASLEHLPATPQETPYLAMKLPTPREIVPWNADPLQISTQSPVPPTTPSQRLATLVILRYDTLASDTPELDGPNGFVWKPLAVPLGTERIVTISVEPTDEDDLHTHARKAFKHLKVMLAEPRY
jgi:hypothetical protein